MFKLSDELNNKIEAAINPSSVIVAVSTNSGCGDWACSNTCWGHASSTKGG